MHQTPIVTEQTHHGHRGWHGHLEGEIDSLRTGITDAGYNLIRAIRSLPAVAGNPWFTLNLSVIRVYSR